MMIQRFLNSLPKDIPDSPIILDVGSYTGEQACEFALQFCEYRICSGEPDPLGHAPNRRRGIL